MRCIWFWPKSGCCQSFGFRGLGSGDTARARRLTMGVLRHLGRIDHVLQPHVPRRPHMAVQNILRLGTYEILADGAGPHGVVDTAVSLSKARTRTRRAAGMINAVLRKVAESGPQTWQEALPGPLPAWLRKPLAKAYGHDTLLAIEAAHRAGAPIDLTPKQPGITVPGAVPLPTGSLRLTSGQVSALPGFADGDWWVQDAAAALPARLFTNINGARVLDMCAAPGGKTLQLAAAGADVTAIDISGGRMARLEQNLGRVGLRARLVVADALTWEPDAPFDAILIDAPCSASGTIRRHPDLPYVKSAGEIEVLTRLQMHVLDRARALVRPGGQIVYCTCSLLPDEGENQIKAALDRHDDLTVLPIAPGTLGGAPAWASPEGGLRLRPDFWPDLGGMDGFYMARLHRR